MEGKTVQEVAGYTPLVGWRSVAKWAEKNGVEKRLINGVRQYRFSHSDVEAFLDYVVSVPHRPIVPIKLSPDEWVRVTAKAIQLDCSRADVIAAEWRDAVFA
jgi:hypothetical protein